MRCQSFMQPSTAEYWHIGAITIRLASSRLPIVIGLNNADFDIAASLQVRVLTKEMCLFNSKAPSQWPDSTCAFFSFVFHDPRTCPDATRSYPTVPTGRFND